jgi:UDP-glucose 4-epimerase
VRCLVTGGAGFIGSHIVEKLIERGNQVRVLDNFSTGKRENLRSVQGMVEVIEGDIRDYDMVRRAIDGIDVVFHEAAISSVVRSIEDPIENDAVNVGGTLKILHAAHEAKVKRVVYASSAAVYGNGGTIPKTESMTPNPESPYAVSKLAGEYYCRVFSRLYGLHTVCLRYFNVFGERQDPGSEYSGVISKFASALVADEIPVVYGDGEQSRDFVYVGNVVEANLLASTVECEAGVSMNVGCAVKTTLNELVRQMGCILGKEVKPIYRAARPGDVRESLADIGLAERELGYKVGVDLIEGLRRTVSSMRGGTGSAFRTTDQDALLV